MSLVMLTALVPAAVLGIVVGLLGGWIAGLAALIVVLAAVVASLWWGSEPLARRLVGGSPADARVHARLINVLEGLSGTVGVPMPELVVIGDPALNTLVFGRAQRGATLVVTEGLLGELTRVELEGILAEQLLRIKRLDILPETVAVATLGAGSGLLAGEEPETSLDRAAAGVTRYPPGLLGAFEKLQAKGTALAVRPPRAVAHLWLADPGGRPTRDIRSTPLSDRIEALREL
jgi:Zn-dependent protease with chaperone function